MPPALEMTLLGATLEFGQSAMVAVSGASCECKVGSYRIAQNTAVEVPLGGVLQCGSTDGGGRAYLAVRGGLEVPIVMDSASTDIRGGFGGFQGRSLRAGDVLQVGKATGARVRHLRAEALHELQGSGPIRITHGAQHEWFAPGGVGEISCDCRTPSASNQTARVCGSKERPSCSAQQSSC